MFHNNIIIIIDYRWLYWNSNRGIERMSMDGKNRTVVIGVDASYYDNIVLSLALDYQAQVLYWFFCDRHNNTIYIKRSNIDGTNQKTILQLNDSYYYNYCHYYHLDSWGLTMYNETLFLSSPRTREVYKLGTNGENFITLINSSAQVSCRFYYYQLKVTKQPSG